MKHPCRYWTVLVLTFCGVVFALPMSGLAAELTFPIEQHATIDGAGQSRILIDFGDLKVLAGKKILYAKLTFELAGDTCERGLDDLAIEPLTREWSSQTVRWMSPWDSAGGDFAHTGTFVSPGNAGLPGAREILLTPLVQAWVDGKQPYHGLIIFPLNAGCDIRLAARHSDGGHLGGAIFIRYQERRK